MKFNRGDALYFSIILAAAVGLGALFWWSDSQADRCRAAGGVLVRGTCIKAEEIRLP